MRISTEEQEAIRTVCRLGEQFGYGNLMQHMATAWARMLMQKYGMEEKTARLGSLLDGYPFLMQEDLMERGEWDESGVRYANASALK